MAGRPQDDGGCSIATNPAYTLIQQNDDDIPPTYESASSSQQCGNMQEPKVGGSLPDKLPSYELATNLPTYEDTQQIKEAEARDEAVEMLFGTSSWDKDEIYVDGVAVGTDCMFIFAFVLSFFFNWLGFFIGYCIMLNLAGRYGAVSGFGLSVVNWLIYLKYAHHDKAYLTEERLFMWWFFLILASLLTLKGIVNWAKARKLLDLTPEQRQSGRVVILY